MMKKVFYYDVFYDAFYDVFYDAIYDIWCVMMIFMMCDVCMILFIVVVSEDDEKKNQKEAKKSVIMSLLTVALSIPAIIGSWCWPTLVIPLVMGMKKIFLLTPTCVFGGKTHFWWCFLAGKRYFCWHIPYFWRENTKDDTFLCYFHQYI